MAQLALIQNLVIRWHHLHCLQSWPPLPHCLGLPYWHYQFVLSWYLHQPESHQLSLKKVLLTSGPKDRTPGLPGSDKNKKFIVIEVTTCEATFNLLPLISGPIQNRLFLLFSLKSFLNVNLVMALYSYWYCHVTQFTNKTNNILIYFSIKIIFQSLNSNLVMQEHEEKTSVPKMVSF